MTPHGRGCVANASARAERSKPQARIGLRYVEYDVDFADIPVDVDIGCRLHAWVLRGDTLVDVGDLGPWGIGEGRRAGVHPWSSRWPYARPPLMRANVRYARTTGRAVMAAR